MWNGQYARYEVGTSGNGMKVDSEDSQQNDVIYRVCTEYSRT